MRQIGKVLGSGMYVPVVSMIFITVSLSTKATKVVFHSLGEK